MSVSGVLPGVQGAVSTSLASSFPRGFLVMGARGVSTGGGGGLMLRLGAKIILSEEDDTICCVTGGGDF